MIPDDVAIAHGLQTRNRVVDCGAGSKYISAQTKKSDYGHKTGRSGVIMQLCRQSTSRLILTSVQIASHVVHLGAGSTEVLIQAVA